MNEHVNNYVLITTLHKGVFAGYLASDDAPKSVTLREARCAIYFGTTGGFLELADTGPTAESSIGAVAPEVTLFDITSITQVTDEAREAWINA